MSKRLAPIETMDADIFQGLSVKKARKKAETVGCKRVWKKVRSKKVYLEYILMATILRDNGDEVFKQIVCFELYKACILYIKNKSLIGSQIVCGRIIEHQLYFIGKN